MVTMIGLVHLDLVVEIVVVHNNNNENSCVLLLSEYHLFVELIGFYHVLNAVQRILRCRCMVIPVLLFFLYDSVTVLYRKFTQLVV